MSTDDSTLKEGDIVTIDGWCQAPLKSESKAPARELIKPLPMKMVNGTLHMLLDEGYAPVMDDRSKNGKWMFDGAGWVLGKRPGCTN